MRICSLFLRHFRGYQEAYVDFHPGINLIHGSNAQGKTTLLEALYCLSIGRSFRSRYYQELIQHGAPAFQIEGLLFKHDTEQTIRFFAGQNEKRIFLNSNLLPSLGALIGLVKGVVITPDDVNLIKGAPALRRQYLDLQLSQGDARYLQHLSRFTKAMRHRNQLLKSKSSTGLDSWENEMAHSGAYVTFQRMRVLTELQAYAQHYYHELSGEAAQLSLNYKCDAPAGLSWEELSTHYLQRYQKLREKESMLGYSLAGPHKHDFTILLHEAEARLYASEGQQRTCIHALRFGEWRSLKESTAQMPILMIDDVGMSLDKGRRERLMTQLSGLGQVFLTATDAAHFPVDAFLGKAIALPLGKRPEQVF